MIFYLKISITNAILQLCTCYCLVYEKINFECLLTNWLHVLSFIQSFCHYFTFFIDKRIKVECVDNMNEKISDYGKFRSIPNP